MDKKKSDAPLGKGMAEDARKTLKTIPAYKDYQMTAYSSGNKPVSFEDWKKGKR
jgi:hypothetical protein